MRHVSQNVGAEPITMHVVISKAL